MFLQNISEQEDAVVCSQCVALLDSAFVFRTTCLDTEKRLRRISSVYYTDLVKIMKKKGESVDAVLNSRSTPGNTPASFSR